MNAQFKKGALELCVLAQCFEKDKYGYEMTEKISEKMIIATGTLYLILKRCKDEGYFETYLKESEEGPARKYYHLTEKGKEYYLQLRKEWNTFTEIVKELVEEED